MSAREPRLTIVAPAFYPSMRHVRYLIQSAERNRSPLHLYGIGEQYLNWHQVQITRLLSELETRVRSKWILYTDASDAILLSGTQNILWQHELLGQPDILMSVEVDGQVCAGGWMADRHQAIEALRELDACYQDSNPQVRWRQAIAADHFPITLDVGRAVFQVADEPLEVVPSLVHPRIHNPRTDTLPCVVHWAGGFTHQQYGKAAQIEETWQALGYPATVTDEELKEAR